jgi:hypothetical protein
MEPSERKRLDRISETLYRLMRGEHAAPLPEEGEPDDEIRQVGSFLNALLREVDAARETAQALSGGDLDAPIDGHSRIAGAMKNLQATLRHLTWQTGRIAAGDFSQRLDFLGDLSQSFNTMVEQLDESRRQLMAKNEELAEARDRAEASERAKSDFLAIMSHEIRTPLGGMIATARLLLDTPLEPEQRRYAQTVAQSGEALLTVINDVLDFSKYEKQAVELEHAPFNLRAVAQDVVMLLAPKAQEKGIALTLEWNAPREAVWGDANRLRQMLLNLLSNAVKFTETGGVVVRSAPSARGNDWLLLQVEDTGIGIAPEQLARLFEPYAQADASIARRFGGTGLGLAIVKRIAEVMGGEVFAESTPGKGSSFTLEAPLPPVPDAPVQSTPTPADPEQDNTAEDYTGMDVLVAEDNAVNQMVARRMLEREGCTCDIAGDGGEALALARRKTYSLILLDMNMPVLDGPGAAEAIRRDTSRNAATPMAALTASTLAEDEERCRKAGIEHFLAKPLSREVLLGLLRRVSTST